MAHRPLALGVLVDRVSKRYRGMDAPAVDDVTFEILPGEFLAIQGPSGSGKSTLLNLVGGIDQASSGRITVGGADLALLSDDHRSDLRLRHLGFVFQSLHLLPTLTAEENVAWPAVMCGVRWRLARLRARALLARVGVAASLAGRLPSALSGGERQLVAVARAMVNAPGLLLADEPTGSIDGEAARTVLRLLKEINTEDAVTVVLVSHNPSAVRYAGRVIELSDGRLAAKPRAVWRSVAVDGRAR
jgi:putative ABC transport system ATP-binding protein